MRMGWIDPITGGSSSAGATGTVGGLFGPIPTHRHTAPAARVAMRPVQEQQRTRRTLTRLDVYEVLVAHQLPDGPRNRNQKRIARAPAPDRAPGQGSPWSIASPITLHNLK